MTAARVLYAGSFSKVMFPALRLGYLVVPEALLESFRRARAALDDYPGPGLQPALAAFIAEAAISAATSGRCAGAMRRGRRH